MYFYTNKSQVPNTYLHIKSVVKELQPLFDLSKLANTMMDDQGSPALIFVDITAGDDILDDFHDAQTHPYIVIIDSENQFAQTCVQRSAELCLRDYLNLPLYQDDILNCLDRYFHWLERKKTANKNNLVIKDKGAQIYIETTSIKLLEGFGSYTRIHTADRVYIVSKTIKKILELLPNQFIRTHRSFAVHQKQVRSLMGNTLLLQNGESVKVSKAGRQIILNHFNKAS